MSSESVIRNGRVLLPDGKLVVLDVMIRDGRIAAMGEELRTQSEVDASDCYVLPGLIDLHTHGIGCQSASLGTLAEYAALEASRGATTFYPTFFGPPEESAEHMRRHRRETEELRQLPQIGGFRLESPYLSFPGGGLSKDLAPIAEQTTSMLQEAGGGHLKIWDVSPELPGALELIKELSDSGIVCSLAHMRATVDQAHAAVDAGARLVTHLFDTFVVPEMVDPGVYPVSVIDHFLVDDRVTCEIVGDGTHVHPLLVEKTLRCKGVERTAFVTDSNFGAGLPSGTYLLPGGYGNALIDGSNNGVRLIDRGMELAGSALTPIDSFRNAVRLFGKDIATASRVSSATPARLMGLNKGEIAVGRDADFVVLDTELELLYTVVAGIVVYAK